MKTNNFAKFIGIFKKGLKNRIAAMKRLDANLATEYKQMRELREARNAPAPSVREVCKNLLQARLDALAEGLPRTGASMGGVRILKVSLSAREWKARAWGVSDDTREYARSSKWRARHYRYEVVITPDELRRAQIINGVFTVLGDFVAPKVRKARWVRLAGTRLNPKPEWVEGFVTAQYHAQSIEDALRWRREEAARLAKARHEIRLRAEKKRACEARFFGVQHAREAGMCVAGIEAFLRRAKIDPEKIGGLRGDVIIELVRKFSPDALPRVERMVYAQ